MSRYIACMAVAGLSIMACMGPAAAAGSASFESLDKNSDGKISMDEASASDKLFVAFKSPRAWTRTRTAR